MHRDKNKACRVPSNPWGFTVWFRSVVAINQDAFEQKVRTRRGLLAKSRLIPIDDAERALAKSDQIPLPPMIPSELDAQEAVALKLLKRNLNIHYESLPLKRPPSIYLAKRAGSVGYVVEGLTAQLIVLAESTAAIMREHLANGTRPQEVNPSYEPDKINDRWSSDGADGRKDMEEFAKALRHLAQRLRRLARAPLTEIADGMSELFGERIGGELRRTLAARYDTRTCTAPNLIQLATGNVMAPALVRPAADQRSVPRHNFHPMIIYEGPDDET